MNRLPAWSRDWSGEPIGTLQMPPRKAETNGNGKRETKGVTLTLGPNINFVSSDGGKTITRLFGGPTNDVDQVTRATAFAASAYCYIAIRYRMRKIAEAPLIVVEEDAETGDHQWLPDHPLAPLLEEPSPDYDMAELVARTVAYVDVTGGAIWVKDVSRGGLVGRLTPFHRDEFTVEDADDRIYGRYRLESNALPFDRREKAPEEVVHFQEPDPFDWWRGTSKVDVALQALNLGQQAIATAKDVLRHALFPSTIVQTADGWNPDSQEFAFFKQTVENYAKRDNRGKPLILMGGGRATQVGLSLRDLLPTETLRTVETMVAGAFGVPPIVLGFQVGLENSPWSNITEARGIAYEDGIAPEWRAMEARITRQLLRAPVQPGGPPFDTDRSHLVVFDTSGIKALQKDVVALTAVAVQQEKIASLNERRALVGLEPVDDPRADEIPELAAPEPPPPGEDFENPFALPEPEPTEEEASWLPTLTTKSAAREVWRHFDLSVKQATETWEAPIANELAVERDVLVRMAERILGGKGRLLPLETKKVEDTDVDALEEEFIAWLEARGIQRLKAIAYPLVLGTATAGVRSVSSQVGVTFQLLQPGLTDYAARETVFLAEAMGKTTGELVAGLVQEGLEAGDTVQKLVQRLRDSAAFTRTRAKVVARTETTRAWNGAQREQMAGYQERTGTQVRKSWLTAGDDRVRDEHAVMEGETRGVDDAFSNGLQAPGEPNCRCTMTYSLGEP